MRASSFIIGAIVGGAATYYYLNRESGIKHTSYQVKARYNKAKDIVNDVEDELGDIIGKQES
ncbi:MAG: hypothetical protein GXY40_00490 [Syntrophomonadaceae bacterium]|nr:hypothetical protein [Syntrophomonadaceae bacterium]